jgi:3-oxoacyl-[acyl-carrier protein] reductase
MELGLKGKVAVITGGSEGIGKACAIRLAAEGVKVAICARRRELLDQVADGIKKSGGEVLAVVADVSKAADIERFMQAVVDRYGRVDILVNNAGASMHGKFLEVSDEMWDADLQLKLFGAIRCSRLAIPHMKKHGGGRIINITTTNGKQPRGASAPTSVTRAAGMALTKVMSKEFAADNILVNTVCIAKIKSAQHDRTAAKEGISVEALYAREGKLIPMLRVGEAEEVADAIVFLSSNGASYITGTSINLDGGASGVL